MNDCEYCMSEKKIDCVEEGRAKIIKTPYPLGYFIEFDNSGGEYPKGEIAISFCPMCGRKLNLDYVPRR